MLTQLSNEIRCCLFHLSLPCSGGGKSSCGTKASINYVHPVVPKLALTMYMKYGLKVNLYKSTSTLINKGFFFCWYCTILYKRKWMNNFRLRERVALVRFFFFLKENCTCIVAYSLRSRIWIKELTLIVNWVLLMVSPFFFVLFWTKFPCIFSQFFL